MTPLYVSFGGAHPARITRTATLRWPQVIELLRESPETTDKAARGWFIPARFSPSYRDSENFVERTALTLDFDHVTPEQAARFPDILEREGLAAYGYTTWSHTPEKPRWRIVMPLSRPASYDEFQAVSRQVADRLFGIELPARESHVPAQMMYPPTTRPSGESDAYAVAGSPVDVDGELARYTDWTDRTLWPRRREADGVHEHGESVDPRTKPGLVGAFCRAYTIPQAIETFELPYTPTEDPNRWTYTAGSRPEGVVIYDDATKAHSHHDTDPARGQNNAFDLVRLHRFGWMDGDTDLDKSVTDRPSYREMCALVADDPAVRAQRAQDEFEDLGPLPAGEDAEPPAGASTLPMARRIDVVIQSPSRVRWLLRDEIERGVMALMVGPRGSYKSFHALHWAMRVAVGGDPVYVVSAEGSDFGRRAKAWFLHHDATPDVPLYVVERRLDLSVANGVEAIRADCVALGIRPALFVLDTFSKLSGGLDENDNSAVKAFIGRLDRKLKRADTGFDSTVLLVTHTGHSDASRARGASALEADTDAAYVVGRRPDGTVGITRERFKSSPELPPLIYRPKVVSLDEVDEDLVPVTSLVLEPADSDGLAPGGRNAPTGKLQKRVLKRLREEGGTLDVTTLIDRCAADLPRDEGQRDRRREAVRRALESLAIEEFVFVYGDTVSTSRAVEIQEDWLG